MRDRRERTRVSWVRGHFDVFHLMFGGLVMLWCSMGIVDGEIVG